MQSKRMSLIESITNTSIGYCVAIATQIIVLPMFGVYLKASDNIKIVTVFTVVGTLRYYIVRRLFNG